MNHNRRKPVKINLDIGKELTHISCGHIVAELIKFIAYQRLQIPYTYQWLKQIVNKKKMSENQERKESFQSEKHFRVASTSLENLDFILKSILQEINDIAVPVEVCIALGATPVTCKEVYHLLLPVVCHKTQCQSNDIATDQNIQRNVFKTLVTSELLSEVFSNALGPTNTYIFLKKKVINNQESVVNTDNFVPTSGFRISRSCKNVVIDFRTKGQVGLTCCNNFQIFGDNINENFVQLQLNDDSDEDDKFNEIESTNDMKWYQSSYVMKGFKDCVVNGKSVTNMWLE